MQIYANLVSKYNEKSLPGSYVNFLALFWK